MGACIGPILESQCFFKKKTLKKFWKDWTDFFVEFLAPATAAALCFFVLNFCHLKRLLFDICFDKGLSNIFFGREFRSPATAAKAAVRCSFLWGAL